METLVLTGCIDPGEVPYLVINDIARRIADYEWGIRSWIERSSFTDIVFGENSGHPYDYSGLRSAAAARGKRLEVLSFAGNHGSRTRGKGHGEGEILAHVLRCSELLRGSASFFKATGRIFVRNADRIRVRDAAKPTIFIRYWSTDVVDTRFFKAEVGFFERVLGDAYLDVDDHAGRYLEHVYNVQLEGRGVAAFSEFPDIVGDCASDGRNYEKTRAQLRQANRLLRLGYYTIR